MYRLLLFLFFMNPLVVVSQASSSGTFEFNLQFPTDRFNSYQLSYMPRDGHVLNDIYVNIDMESNIMNVKGKNEYVVGVDFPLLVIAVMDRSPEIVASTSVISFHKLERYTGSVPTIEVDTACPYSSVSFIDNGIIEPNSVTTCCDHEYCKQQYNIAIESSHPNIALGSAAFDNKSVMDFNDFKSDKELYFLCDSLIHRDFDKMEAFTTRYGAGFSFMNANYGPTAFAKARQHNEKIARLLMEKYGGEWYSQLPIQPLGLQL
jgi:hypothetical protein